MWEGNWTVRELERARYPIESTFAETHPESSMITFVRCDPGQGWRPIEMMKTALAAVADYERWKLAWKKEFRDSEILLASVERTVTREKLRVQHAGLKRLLANTGEAIERRRKVVSNFRNRPRGSLQGVLERISLRNIETEIVRPEIDLESRLQLQVAQLFRIFIHKEDAVSLRTIARLVVLLYQVTGLGSEMGPEGFLRLKDTRRRITVRSVEEKLRRKGIR